MTDVELEVDALIVGGMAPEQLRSLKMRFDKAQADENDMDVVTIDNLKSNIIKDLKRNECVLIKDNIVPRVLAVERLVRRKQDTQREVPNKR